MDFSPRGHNGFGHHQTPIGRSHHGPQSLASTKVIDPLCSSDDLHAWSLFRQNLNANFSESALHSNVPNNGNVIPTSHYKPSDMTGNQRPMSTNDNFQLRESTLNNILSHPKYGPQLKSQDAFTYLRFGLPRVKTTLNLGTQAYDQPLTDHKPPNRSQTHFNKSYGVNNNENSHNNNPNGHSSNVQQSDELKRRFWNSDHNFIRSSLDSSDAHSDISIREVNHTNDNRVQSRMEHQRVRTSIRNKMKSSYSVTDLRYKTPNPVSKDEYGGIGRLTSSARGQYPYMSSMMLNDDVRLDPIGPGSSLPPPRGKNPHLVVKDLLYEVDKSPIWRRMCGVSRQKLRVLEDITFDVRGGELLACLATSAAQGTALLDVLANRFDHRNGTVRSEMYLNGVTITPRHLARMASYVQRRMDFCPTMSTQQALLFTCLMMGPAVRGTVGSADMRRRTRTILDELNLSDVKHTKLSQLTDSERRRLHIAIHLLLDTELLILDQPLEGLDIFDSFFLVEYLRQWASIGGRLVILTISPPTYEVFTMLNRVLLLSAGRSLYVGTRRDFIKYFTSLDFPCPPFKNPSDYYLDLVTMDDLSQEALIESSQRVESLAETHLRRPLVDLLSSMPGPPAVTPPSFRRANLAIQFLALWIRALIFTFPYNVVHLFNRFLGAFLLSLSIGSIYWQVRSGVEQEYVWDRIGFIQTMLGIGIVPLLLSELSNAYREKKQVLCEVEQGFYSLPAYILAKTLYSTPQSILVGLAYALPACSMAGLHLHTGPNSLPYYLLVMLSYYIAMRTLVTSLVWTFERRSTAIYMFAFLFAIFMLGSGTMVQLRNLPFTHRWLRSVSPVRWVHESLIGWEFEPNVQTFTNQADGSSTLVSSFMCSRNPVIQQPNAILVRADCGFQTRVNILKWFDYHGSTTSSWNDLRPWWHGLVALLILYIISLMIGSIQFCLHAYYYRDDRSKTHQGIE